MSESKNDRYFSKDSRFADYGVDENRTEISYQSADIIGGGGRVNHPHRSLFRDRCIKDRPC